jgi:hypothetical protein
MDIPSGLAAQTSLLRQNVAMSVIKASADADQMMAQILDESVRSAPVGASRGANVNVFA